MKKELKESMAKFISEAKSIDGAEDAIFKLCTKIKNRLILSGQIYGKHTNDKLNKLAWQNGFLLLARDLSVLYDKPIKK